MTKTKGRSSPSPRKSKFAVFDFSADDERPEKESKITVSRFKKKKSPQKHSPINKYTFLHCFARGEKKSIRSELGNDLVDIDSSDVPMDGGIIKSDTAVSSGSSDCKPLEHNHTECHGSEVPSLATTPSSARLSGIVTDDKHNEPVIVDSDDDPVIELISPKSPSIAQCQGLLGEQALKYSPSVHDTEALVVVCPDYIIYRDVYSRNSRLTFSPKCVKLEASPISGTRPFTHKLMVSAIYEIHSSWCDSMKTASLEVHLISETRTMRVVRELLIFGVYDPAWSDKQKAIQSLDFRYKDTWRTARVETMRSEFPLELKRFSPSSTCFPILEETFHVIYPKGDPDAISISKKDVDRLQPKTFINDTIIDFYITYLKNNICPEEKKRFHFFNCFFFRKLADLDKDPSQACEGRAAFQRVRRWTMKVDIFKIDYIFVPINFSFHWSLIVICHPGEVAGYRDNEVENSSMVPCILHMDSLRGSHKGLKNLFQSYLWEEWKERHGELAEDVRRKFLNLQFVHLKLPQQENLFDCGLFLLHYVELFLEQAPVNFGPVRTTVSPKFLSKDWFWPKDVSYKRDHIKKLIFEIFKHTRGDSSTDSDYNRSSNSIDEEHAGVELVNELCSFRETSQISDLHSPADAEVQIMSLPRTHVKSLKFAGVSDLVPGDLSPRVDTPKPTTINKYMHSGQKLTGLGSKTMSIEEEEETGETLMDSPALKCMHSGQELTNHGCNAMSPIEEEEETGEEFMDFSPALKKRSKQIELFALCPVNEDNKLYFGTSTSWVCHGVKSSSSSGEESADCIVVDNCDTSEHSSYQNTNTDLLCSIEADSTEHEANNHIQSLVQKEDQASIKPRQLPEIIQVSGSDIGEDKGGECCITSSAESAAAYIVEDSEEDEDNVEGSMNRVQPLWRSKKRSGKVHMRRLIIDLSEDLHSKQFYE